MASFPATEDLPAPAAGHAQPLHLAWLAAVAVVLALQAALVVTHEPFVDEWQALQLAVQSPDMAALLQNLSYEGHPPLWHLVLRLFAFVVGPAHALAAAALVFGLGSQLLLLLRAPFPHWLRLALALGEPLLFDFGVVSRSYTLGVFLLFAGMALWNHRRLFWLPFALLPCTEFLFGVMTLGLLAMRWKDGRLWWPGVAIWAAASLLAAWTIIPAADFVPVNNASKGVLQGTVNWLVVLGSVGVPFQWDDGPRWNGVPANLAWMVLWIAVLAMMVRQTAGRAMERLTLGLFLLVTWCFFAFLYSLALRHMLLVSALFIAVLWHQAGQGVRPVLLTRAWAIVGALCGLVAAAFNFTMPFDRESDVARFITAHDLAGETWVSLPVQHGQGVSAMTGVLFEGAAIGCRADFIRWNFEETVTSPAKLGDWLGEAGQRQGRFYLLSDRPAPAGSGAVLLEHLTPGYIGKNYYIYRVNGDQPQVRAPRPQCVSGMAPMPPLGF